MEVRSKIKEVIKYSGVAILLLGAEMSVIMPLAYDQRNSRIEKEEIVKRLNKNEIYTCNNYPLAFYYKNKFRTEAEIKEIKSLEKGIKQAEFNLVKKLNN